VVSIRKQYPGHAKRVMFGIWSFLRQFMYTKFIIVVDEDVNIRDWKEVIWALTTRMDATRDTTLVDNTPIDYLDFASPVAGLGSKMGLDATNKWPGETHREWGTPIVMDAAVKAKVDAMWVAAVILNYWNQNAVRGTWLESHFRWQIRTFWFAVLWIAVSALMVVTIIGVPFALALLLIAGLWILYRVVRGWWKLMQRETMPMA
jgi:uncharacterized membrane protein